MTDSMVIRRAIPLDAAACAGIVNRWIDATSWLPRIQDPDVIERMIYAGIPKREFYVIGDPIAGYLSLDPEINQINGFYIDRPGEGLGKALLDHVKRDRDFVQLWTHEPNKRARKFYQREGFVEKEHDPDRSEEGVVEVRMEWRA